MGQDILKTKTFSNGLVVKHRRYAVIFENKEGKAYDRCKFYYQFSDQELRELLYYLEDAGNQCWKGGIHPKEGKNPLADYYEYYDKNCDDNGCLKIARGDTLAIHAPFGSMDTLYQFSKPKLEAFLYDLRLVCEDALTMQLA